MWGRAALAQGDAAARPASGATPKIVVIDINHIYKNFNRFKQRMEAHNAEIQKAKDGFKTEAEEIQRLSEQLSQYQKDSPDYRNLEEQVTKRQGEFTARAQLQEKSFLEQRANIYYETYLEIQKELQYFTQKYGIELVLRFNREQPDHNNWQSVATAVNAGIVFQNNLDITEPILNLLNQRSASAADVSQNPGVRQGVVPRNQ
jgi:Skp family chaperone for outer membrane proteins